MINKINGRRIFSSFFILLSFISVFSILSCATKKPDIKRLNYKVDLYNKFLVWQKFYDAEKMLPEDLKDEFPEKWKKVRYTDIVVNEIKPNESGDKVTVILTRKYYLKINPVIHEERVKQIWEFKDKSWHFVSETVIKED